MLNRPQESKRKRILKKWCMFTPRNMHLLRENFTRRVFILLTGIAFLNLSFLVAEIRVLELTSKYKSLIQLVNNSGLEEEKEAGGEGGESDASEEVEDIIEHSLTCYRISISILKQETIDSHAFSVRPGHAEKYSPPPDGRS
jgi:hypothetical protein